MASTSNDARPGDRVAHMTCCDGGRLVRESAVQRWECGRCFGPGRMVRLLQFDKGMNLVELSMKEARSYL